MRKLSFAAAFFIIFLIGVGLPAPVLADCTPATGMLQSCAALTTRCVVGSNAGVGKRTVLCCTTSAECTTQQMQANQQQSAGTTGATAVAPANSVCKFAGAKQADCDRCMKTGTAAWTALGCIQTDPQQFIGAILRIAIGIGGGVAFLLILFGGFQILTSAGNPEQLTAGREVVTSAITGLLLIIFSIFLLRLIGYNIFGIPGFG